MEDNIEPHDELAELLNGEEKPDLNSVETPEAEPTGEKVEETPEPEVPPTAEAEPEEDHPKPDPEPEEDARVQALIAKGQDEVAKRQRAEADLANLRREVEQLKAANQPKIDPYEDPEGYQRQQEFQAHQRDLNTRIEMSEMILKAQNDDYDEVIEVFKAEAVQNPALVQAMQSSPIPAKYAYTEGKRLQTMREMGDNPEAYVNRLVEERLATKLAELQPKPKPDLPKTIANAGTKAPTMDEVPSEDLASLLGEI